MPVKSQMLQSVVTGKTTSAYSCLDTIVEQQTSQNSVIGFRRSSLNQKIAQTFLTTEGGHRCKVIFQLKKYGSPTGNVWVEVFSTSAGAPTGSALYSSDTLDVSTLTTTLAEKTFTVTFPVSDATTYAIVLNSDVTISGTNYLGVGHYTSDIYADGVLYRWNGSAWSIPNADYDAVFKVLK